MHRMAALLASGSKGSPLLGSRRPLAYPNLSHDETRAGHAGQSASTLVDLPGATT